MVKKYGPWFDYDLHPRAQIFKRDQSKVVDLPSMMKLMRLVGNNFYWTKGGGGGGGGWSPDGVVFSDIEQIKPMENVPVDLATTSKGYTVYSFATAHEMCLQK